MHPLLGSMQRADRPSEQSALDARATSAQPSRPTPPGETPSITTGRSARAVNALAKLGFTNVYSMVDGFEGDKDKDGKRTVNGWKNDGLAWSYKLTPERIYRSPGT